MLYYYSKINFMVKLMKKLIFLVLILFTAVGCKAQTASKLITQNGKLDTNKVITPLPIYSTEDRVITAIFTRYHYNRVNLNDSLSSVILDNYIKSLDYNKLYFLKSDIKNFNQYRDKLDNDLKFGNVKPFYKIFNVFKKRLNERIKYITKRLTKKFNFSLNQTFEPDRKNKPFASSATELDSIWNKRLKNDELSLKLSGKKWKGITKILLQRYQRFQRALLQYKSEDVFQLAMNSFASAIDPHTDYFSPIASQNFKINMSLSLEGIGAQLMTDNDFTKIVRIIPGGPAYKSGKLHADDRIVSVGQGDKGEMVDIIGWRLDDVVQLIRGKKGTVVRLGILPAGAVSGMPIDTIKLVREKVKLEGMSAKKKIIDIKNDGKNYRIGVIDVPAFYVDFEAMQKGNPDYKSTTRDVKKLITELKKEGIDGLIIDLRNDGGGSLEEAVKMTGLFIKKGPVVQVRNSSGVINVDDDPDSTIFYNGPLSVLVNRYSASASEIFSGAIQDYGRGIIVGERTYGKGTVQNLIDLNRFIHSKEKLGQIKLTIAKFYRITGSSTQNMGVIPDVIFPSPVPAAKFGESAQPSALKWDRIRPTKFHPYENIQSVLPEIIKDHKERIKKDLEFQYLIDNIKEIRKLRKKKFFSLNFKIRKAQQDSLSIIRKKRENEINKLEKLKLKGLKEKPSKEKAKPDPELNETGHILADLIRLIK